MAAASAVTAPSNHNKKCRTSADSVAAAVSLSLRRHRRRRKDDGFSRIFVAGDEPRGALARPGMML